MVGSTARIEMKTILDNLQLSKIIIADNLHTFSQFFYCDIIGAGLSILDQFWSKWFWEYFYVVVQMGMTDYFSIYEIWRSS